MKVIVNATSLVIGWSYTKSVTSKPTAVTCYVKDQNDQVLSEVTLGLDNRTIENSREADRRNMIKLINIAYPRYSGKVVLKTKNRNFIKEVFRKDSLSKALRNAFPGSENKNIRATIWESYLSRNKKEEILAFAD